MLSIFQNQNQTQLKLIMEENLWTTISLISKIQKSLEVKVAILQRAEYLLKDLSEILELFLKNLYQQR